MALEVVGRGTSRDPHDPGIGRDVLGHDGTRSHGGGPANRKAGKQDSAGSDDGMI